MRSLRIMLLHFEHIAEHRVRSFVWFLVSLFNPLLFILFWIGAFQGKTEISSNWTTSSITSYYLLLTIAGAMLMSHIEDDVARQDIQNGELVNYLLRPFSYFWMKFFEEIHYRLLQGFYALIVFFIFSLFFHELIKITTDPIIVFFGAIIITLALLLSYVFKMIIGLLAFWTVDIRGIFNLIEIILVIFAGYIVPIDLLIGPLSRIATALPFAYMIYYPVVVFQGKLVFNQLPGIIIVQIFWLFLFVFVYKFLWNKGVKKFSGIGQ